MVPTKRSSLLSLVLLTSWLPSCSGAQPSPAAAPPAEAATATTATAAPTSAPVVESAPPPPLCDEPASAGAAAAARAAAAKGLLLDAMAQAERALDACPNASTRRLLAERQADAWISAEKAERLAHLVLQEGRVAEEQGQCDASALLGAKATPAAAKGSADIEDPASWCAIRASVGRVPGEEGVQHFIKTYLDATAKVERPAGQAKRAPAECAAIGAQLLGAFKSYANPLALMRMGRCFQTSGDEVAANRWFSRAVAVAGAGDESPDVVPRVTPGHGDDLVAIALDPAGGLLAVGGKSGDLRIWVRDRRQGWLQRWVLSDDRSPVVKLAFTNSGPKAGGWLVSAHENGDVIVWEPRVGARIWQFGRRGEVRGMVVAPDARAIVTLQDDGALRAFTTDGTLLAAADAEAWETYGLAGTTDASWLTASVRLRPTASVKDHGVLEAWKLERPAVKVKRSAHWRGEATAWRFAPGPRWDAPADTWLGGPALSPSGRRLAVSDCRGLVHVFSLGGASPTFTDRIEVGTAKATCDRPRGVAFLDESTLVVTDQGDAPLRRWKLASTPEELEPLRLPPGTDESLRDVQSLAVHRTGLFAGLGGAGIARWQLPRTMSEPILDGPAGTVRSITFSPSGRLAVSRGDGRVASWDLALGNAPSQVEAPAGLASPASFTTFTRDGRRAATTYWNGITQLWDVATGTARTLDGRHESGGKPDGAYGAAFNATGKQLVVAGKTSKLLVWDDLDAVAPKPREVPTTHSETNVVAFIGDTSSVVVGEGSCPHLRDLQSGAHRVFQCHTALDKENLFSFAISTDGARLLANRGQDVAVWNVASGTVDAVCRGHEGYVRGVALASDGSTGASAAYDRSVRLWTVDGQTCRETRVFRDLDGDAMWVAFSPDGKILAAATRAGAVYLWDVATGRERGRLYGNKDGWFVIAGGGKDQLRIDGNRDHATTHLRWTVGTSALSGYAQWSRFHADNLLGAIVRGN